MRRLLSFSLNVGFVRMVTLFVMVLIVSLLETSCEPEEKSTFARPLHTSSHVITCSPLSALYVTFERSIVILLRNKPACISLLFRCNKAPQRHKKSHHTIRQFRWRSEHHTFAISIPCADKQSASMAYCRL